MQKFRAPAARLRWKLRNSRWWHGYAPSVKRKEDRLIAEIFSRYLTRSRGLPLFLFFSHDSRLLTLRARILSVILSLDYYFEIARASIPLEQRRVQFQPDESEWSLDNDLSITICVPVKPLGAYVSFFHSDSFRRFVYFSSYLRVVSIYMHARWLSLKLHFFGNFHSLIL